MSPPNDHFRIACHCWCATLSLEDAAQLDERECPLGVGKSVDDCSGNMTRFETDDETRLGEFAHAKGLREMGGEIDAGTKTCPHRARERWFGTVIQRPDGTNPHGTRTDTTPQKRFSKWTPGSIAGADEDHLELAHPIHSAHAFPGSVQSVMQASHHHHDTRGSGEFLDCELAPDTATAPRARRSRCISVLVPPTQSNPDAHERGTKHDDGDKRHPRERQAAACVGDRRRLNRRRDLCGDSRLDRLRGVVLVPADVPDVAPATDAKRPNASASNTPTMANRQRCWLPDLR